MLHSGQGKHVYSSVAYMYLFVKPRQLWSNNTFITSSRTLSYISYQYTLKWPSHSMGKSSAVS